MNPHFQTHNNPSYPQANPGYPQANPHYPQQAQPGPNRYPDLPPIHNPQQNQPYPQYNPSQGGVPGYIPPNQYGNIQGESFDGQNSEKAKLEAQMAELDNNMKSGGVCFYVYWSYFVLIVSIPIALFNLSCYAFNKYTSSEGYLMAGFYALWMALQSYFAVSADRNKSLFKAHAACWMVGIYLTISAIIELVLLVASINYLIHPTGGFLAGIEVYFCVIFTVHILAHIFLNVIGAFKMKKILTERAEVEMKLVEHTFNNQA